MQNEFKAASDEYYKIVKNACDRFIVYLREEKEISVDGKFGLYRYLHESQYSEYYVSDHKYVFHGAGCTVYKDDEPTIQWDFGYRNLWCGIDPYKMAETLKHNCYHMKDYHDSQYLKDRCNDLYASHELRLYKGQYYFDLLRDETIVPAFPEEYDLVIIRDGERHKTFKRSVITDRFIRKSEKIYKYIDRLEGNLILEFYHQDNLIVSVLYNDIAYPDAAYKIMREQMYRYDDQRNI